MSGEACPVFIVLLRFAAAERAGDHVAAHAAWIARGIDDGVFLLAGGLKPRLGGVIVAHATSREELDARLSDDPFVIHGVVKTEILEVGPAKADPRLAFLIG